LFREPIAGTIVHTLAGTPRHLLAEFQQFRKVDWFWELGRFGSFFALRAPDTALAAAVRAIATGKSELIDAARIDFGG